MSIPGYSVKNRVTMTMFYLGVIAFGIFSFMRLQLDLYPDMDIPYILVMTTYIGASPADIETLVSRPIEENAVSVTGVKNVTSTSKENVGIVVLEFDWGYDMDQAEIDTRNNLDLVRDKLPDDADEPIVIAMDPSMSPIVMINLQGDMSSSEIRQVAEDRIQPMLERIDGIASVEVGGGEAVVACGAGEVGLAELGEQFVFLRARHFGLADLGGIAAELDGLAGFEHHVGLREVGVEEGEQRRLREFPFVDELAVFDAHGVDAVERAVLAVHVEFRVVDVL